MTCQNTYSDKISYLLMKIARLHRTNAGKLLGRIDLHPGQEFILMQLWKEDGLMPSQLADRLGVQPPTVTKMLQRMEATGLIERRAYAEDSRVSHVYLTEQGRATRADVEAVWDQLEECIIGDLSIEERVILRRLLMQIKSNLSAFEP
ncbi:MAG: MarR family transcriptional regulator [Chloroflexota bacterium]